MDGQNFNNGQNNQENNYQDYTANASQYQAPVDNRDSSGTNGCQIASLVLGILGIPACCCYGVPGVIFGLIGLILAFIGNSKNKGSGVGIAGLVCSIIALLFGVVATIYYGLIIQGMFVGTGPFADMIREMGYDMYLQY